MTPDSELIEKENQTIFKNDQILLKNNQRSKKGLLESLRKCDDRST
jgi:hypothetical protein